jgi:hypothetical protein
MPQIPPWYKGKETLQMMIVNKYVSETGILRLGFVDLSPSAFLNGFEDPALHSFVSMARPLRRTQGTASCRMERTYSGHQRA